MDYRELTESLIKYSDGNRGKCVPWWDADRENSMYRYNYLTEEEVHTITEAVERCSKEELSSSAGNTGLSLFHLLVWCGLYKGAESALRKGVDSSLSGTGECQGVTPLMAACFRGNEEMTKLLLRHGADSGLCDAKGRNVFHYLAGMRIGQMSNSFESQRGSMPRREAIAGLLSGDINARDREGNTPFEYMLKSNQTNFSWALAKVYIEKGAETHGQDEEGNSLLMTAVRNRHFTAALALMEDRELVNLPNQKGETPLHLAVSNYNLELAMALLDRKADKNLPDEKGRTPKEIALERNDEDYKQLFTTGRLKLNTLSRLTGNAFAGYSQEERDRLSPALYMAGKLIREVDTDDDEEMGYIVNILYSALLNDEKCQILDMLAEAGIDMTAPIHMGGSVECIRDHCLGGNYGVKVIRKLMELGVDMDEALLKGRTPANIVASLQPRNMMGRHKDTYFEEAARLFSRESMEQRDDRGTAAVHEAAARNHVDMLRVMIEKGVDVNLAQDEPGEAGNTPLHLACENGNGEAAALLISSGGDDTIRNVKGETPAHLAMKKRKFGGDMRSEERTAVLEALEHIDIPGNNGRTPLMMLPELDLNMQIDVLPVLLEKGADVNRADDGGNTPLLLTAQKRSYKGLIKELFRAGADVNAENREGNTALHGALRYGDQESAIFLIKKGADYNHANNAGVTPVQIAVEKGYDTVLELMTDIV
ncbi:MAG: ankyrin repeat domain-containing protein [Butyrivibrio sp.]|nr:ankyrin repeat domain-containing protein [Butyrivibrio sp.]